ncbi:hypothetical protein E2C01_054070 [Portunus trituberculatus]|uniref:Transmembrane protein n=1 Tax=Portunus trituberculatus TaxID=210409 RepID=A0A5B7GRS4_PORTR|nr:hypothetical protein [Portunus trituberculatus]
MDSLPPRGSFVSLGKSKVVVLLRKDSRLRLVSSTFLRFLLSSSLASMSLFLLVSSSLLSSALSFLTTSASFLRLDAGELGTSSSFSSTF